LVKGYLVVCSENAPVVGPIVAGTKGERIRAANDFYLCRHFSDLGGFWGLVEFEGVSVSDYRKAEACIDETVLLAFEGQKIGGPKNESLHGILPTKKGAKEGVPLALEGKAEVLLSSSDAKGILGSQSKGRGFGPFKEKG
jgi:hypothetical protein